MKERKMVKTDRRGNEKEGRKGKDGNWRGKKKYSN
jgi:hypothetical protein